MRFAIFDQMERTDAPIATMYRDRLSLLEAADEAGIWCYFKAEHHMTPLDMTPSTSTWLGAVAARTENMRVGSMVYLLPFHHPLRLLEEVTTLDHLSNGRLEIGVGRGVAPAEHELWGLDAEAARPCYEESLEVLLSGLQTDSLTFHGDFWDFDDVPIEQRCLQEPHPPMWYPGNPRYAAERGFNTIIGGPTQLISQVVPMFTELAAAHRDAPERILPGADLSIGASARIIVDHDEAKARDRGRIAWKHHDANLTKLWRRFGLTPVNDPTCGGDFDAALERCMAFAGTPAMLADFIAARAELGIDPMMLAFEWGDLSAVESRQSLDLFVEHVMP